MVARSVAWAAARASDERRPEALCQRATTASLARPFLGAANQPALPVFGLRVLSHFSRQVFGKKRQQLLRIVDRRTGPTL